MTPIQVIIDFFVGGLLLATFLMVGQVRLRPMLRYFALASLFLAGLGASMAFLRGDHDPYLGALATIVFKVILIPIFISLTAKKIPSSYQLRMYLRPSTTYFLFGLILMVSALIVRHLPLSFQQGAAIREIFFFRSLLFLSVSLILVGIFLMMIRKDLFSQILGLMTLENGIAAFALVALQGIPIFLEMGIFLVILLSTVILAGLTEKVHEVYAVGDTEKLNILID